MRNRAMIVDRNFIQTRRTKINFVIQFLRVETQARIFLFIEDNA